MEHKENFEEFYEENKGIIIDYFNNMSGEQIEALKDNRLLLSDALVKVYTDEAIKNCMTHTNEMVFYKRVFYKKWDNLCEYLYNELISRGMFRGVIINDDEKEVFLKLVNDSLCLKELEQVKQEAELLYMRYNISIFQTYMCAVLVCDCYKKTKGTKAKEISNKVADIILNNRENKGISISVVLDKTDMLNLAEELRKEFPKNEADINLFIEEHCKTNI